MPKIKDLTIYEAYLSYIHTLTHYIKAKSRALRRIWSRK